MFNVPLRALRRGPVAVLLATIVLFAGGIVVRAQMRADADTTTTNQNLTCPIIGAVPYSVTATDTPDPAPSGGKVSLAVTVNVTVPAGLGVTVNSVTIGIPAPAQVATLDSVTFTGGTLKGSYTVAADNSSATIVLAGPISSDNFQLPAIVVHTTLKTGTEGQTVSWPGPSSIGLDLAGIGAGSCSGAANNPPLQTTQIATPPTTTTAPPTTTTTAPPTTTSTTTTTAPPTTTSTTTTTRPPTTTTAPPTTAPPTTAPPTTAPPTTAPPTTIRTTTTSVTTTTRRPSTTTTRPRSPRRRLWCLIFHWC